MTTFSCKFLLLLLFVSFNVPAAPSTTAEVSMSRPQRVVELKGVGVTYKKFHAGDMTDREISAIQGAVKARLKSPREYNQLYSERNRLRSTFGFGLKPDMVTSLDLYNQRDRQGSIIQNIGNGEGSPKKNPRLIGGNVPSIFNAKTGKCLDGTAANNPVNDQLHVYCWQINGFREIGRITLNTVDVNDPTYPGRSCAFVMIMPGWAVTPLHCIAESKNGLAEMIGNLRFELCVLDLESQSPADANCNWKQFSATRITYANDWHDASSVPEKDFALLRFSDPQLITNSIQFAHLSRFLKAPASNSEFTIAGFGLANKPSKTHIIGIDLSVAWSKGGLISNNSHFVWSTSDSSASADNIVDWDPNTSSSLGSSCKGDSGGPLYEGIQDGKTDDKGISSNQNSKNLLGILSYVVRPADAEAPTSVPGCIKSSSYFLLVEPFRPWVCEQIVKAGGSPNFCK